MPRWQISFELGSKNDSFAPQPLFSVVGSGANKSLVSNFNGVRICCVDLL